MFLTGAYADERLPLQDLWLPTTWGREIARCEDPGRQGQCQWKVAAGTWRTDDGSVVTGKSRYTSLREPRVQYQKPFFPALLDKCLKQQWAVVFQNEIIRTFSTPVVPPDHFAFDLAVLGCFLQIYILSKI